MKSERGEREIQIRRGAMKKKTQSDGNSRRRELTIYIALGIFDL